MTWNFKANKPLSSSMLLFVRIFFYHETEMKLGDSFNFITSLATHPFPPKEAAGIRGVSDPLFSRRPAFLPLSCHRVAPAGLEVTEIHTSVPPRHWDQRRVP